MNLIPSENCTRGDFGVCKGGGDLEVDYQCPYLGLTIEAKKATNEAK